MAATVPSVMMASGSMMHKSYVGSLASMQQLGPSLGLVVKGEGRDGRDEEGEGEGGRRKREREEGREREEEGREREEVHVCMCACTCVCVQERSVGVYLVRRW